MGSILNKHYVWGLIIVLALTACGESDGRPSGQSDTQDTVGGGSFSNEQSFFSARVQSGLDFCRTCHVPGGVADTDKGERFALSKDGSDDYEKVHAAWQALGEGVEGNRILTKASNTDAEPHSGGAPWPQDSAAYKAMQTLLACWDDPAGCESLLGSAGDEGDGTEELPLLGSSHGSHVWFEFCEGKPDDAGLPPDPRTLVRPGVNEGKAVYFNNYWKTCSTADGPNAQPPTTCGELRERYVRGKELMEGNGATGAGHLLGGDYNDGNLLISAERYNNLWRAWGLSSRPENYDELVAGRYGLQMGMERNPYPLPGEDPNETGGGSGQLPTAFSQARDPDGSWTGKLKNNCHTCHSAEIGTPEDGPGLGYAYGAGSGPVDYWLFLNEAIFQNTSGTSQATSLLGLAPMTVSTTRGLTNALNPFIIGLLMLPDMLANPDPGMLSLLAGAPSTGEIITVPWWNMSHKTTKFYNATLPVDNLRGAMSFFTPIARPPFPFADLEGAKQWIKDHGQDAKVWFLSLESPAYPEEIDTALAEQGAVLFHSKDLWAEGLDNPVPRPQGGNGSCAGCHGAYSPRYAHDPAYLDTPELEGMANFVVPLDVIGTDPAYARGLDENIAEYASREFFFAYPETYGSEQDCTIQSRAALGRDPLQGYAAPPLHGVWATSPYFHNGSVPDLWSVLKPAERPTIWKRVSRPAPPELAGEVVMPFDTSLQTGFDHERVGWKYDVLNCGQAGTTPYVDCDPNAAQLVTQQLLGMLSSNIQLFYNLAPPAALLTTEDIENRKIYNTQLYSHSNEGHEFTSVLTDQERLAIIEYLKTL